MAQAQISSVRLAGIASAIPEATSTVDDLASIFGSADAEKIAASTGVRVRHIAPSQMCTSDLCHAAAERLFADLGWDRGSIDALIFVSQTPDYRLPATSCILQHRLGLPTTVAAFDVNLGCTGYTYGLWLGAQLIASQSARRVLLLVGDTISRMMSPQDRSVAPLFGDAGTATALERCDAAPPMFFELGTDGGGWQHLVVPAGGFRHPHTPETSQRTERESGNIRSDEDIFMDGAEIFAFTLQRVRPMVEALLAHAGWSVADVDAWVMHQANQFILEYLAKKMKLPATRVKLALEGFGNTSSASIPLTMTVSMGDLLKSGTSRLVLVGFGVGLSWASVALSCNGVVLPALEVVPKMTYGVSVHD